MTAPRRLSISGLGDYRKCPALWWFDHLSGIKVNTPSTPEQMRGSVFHHGIARALLDGRTEGAAAYACAEALIYASENSIPLLIAEQAITALDYYVPKLGINTRLKAATLDGVPLVEFGFDATYGTAPHVVRLRGTVDAVVTLPDGRVMLLDWKLRGQAYDAQSIQLDKQVYVYAAILKQVYGVHLDGAAQVQMLPIPPAHLQLLKDKIGVTARDYSRSMGQTTADTIQADGAHLPEAERRSLYQRFADKVAPDSHFLNYAKVDLDHAQRVLHIVLQQADAINRDTEFLPVLDAYTCKACAWQAQCHTRTFKMGV